MKTLVTGGSGFLGRHLVERLRRDGHDVHLGQGFDLTSQAQAEWAFGCDPDVVFHLAAEVGGIGANQVNPGRFWYANLAMGMNVLEQCRLHGVEKLVMVGTVCAYPETTRVPFREVTLWSGYPEPTNAPYGVAKRALLTGVQAYRKQYGLNAIYLLPANLYGPGDNFDRDTSHVIPALIRKMAEARDYGHDSVLLWGDGRPTREFLYVSDCVAALCLAATRYNEPAPVNIGTGEEVRIFNLAEHIATLIGYDGAIVWDSSRPNGQLRRCLDITRARDLFGFEATVDLRTGLERTIDWYLGTRPEKGLDQTTLQT